MGSSQAYAMDLAPEDRRGEFLGVWAVFGNAGALVAPLLIGGIYAWVGPGPAFSTGQAGSSSARCSWRPWVQRRGVATCGVGRVRRGRRDPRRISLACPRAHPLGCRDGQLPGDLYDDPVGGVGAPVAPGQERHLYAHASQPGYLPRSHVPGVLRDLHQGLAGDTP